MVPRLIILSLIVLTLLGLLVYSQRRTEPAKVSGFVEADEIRVGSRVGGRVKAVHVREGQAVKVGDPLIEFEPYDLREKLAQADARLAKSAATLDRLRAGARAQEIAIAEAEVRLAEARLDLAQLTLKRVEPAVRQGASSADELDRAQEEVKAAEAMLASKHQGLALLREGTRKEDIAAAEAQVREDESSAAALRRQIEELMVVAPVEGVVEAIELQPGDLVAANAPALSILDRGTLRIRAYVPENRLNLKVDQPVTVTADSFAGRTFAARIAFISRQAEFMPGNVQTPEERSKQVFRIRAALEGEARELLLPGMPVDLWLDPVAPTTRSAGS